MAADNFRTPIDSADFRQKIGRSEFLAIAFPTSSDDAFFSQLALVQKRWFDATHHCWAFRLFGGGSVRQRSSDAGEPSGTAGKPILFAIERAGLHDAGVIVVRWYGGVKLGSGGLARAYRDTAAKALAIAPAVNRFLYERFSVTVPFASLSTAHRLVEPPAVALAGEEYGDTNVFHFDVRLSRAEAFARSLDERRLVFARDPTPRLR